jgi:glycosyltransferase involved in cell wall biosynthesis
LLLTQVLPYPPDSGGKIKTLNLLKFLAQAHQVSLVSFTRPDDDPRWLDQLRPLCHEVHTIVLRRSKVRDLFFLLQSWLRPMPFVIARDDSAAMRRLVLQLAQEQRFDLVHAVQLNMAPYALAVADVPRVLDQENVVSLVVERLCRLQRPGPKKLALYLEWRKLLRYEGEVCRRFNRVLAVSEADRLALQGIAGAECPVDVIPIGIDVEATPVIPRRPDAAVIVTVGNMHWPPNAEGVLWFLEEVYPLIKQEILTVRLRVVGPRPPAELLRRGQKDASIEVTGYIEDLPPYLEDSAVMVVPLHAGGGMRVKILEGMAMGLPIVSTTIGCEGIAVVAGEHLLVADTPEGFAQATVSLMRDRARANELAHCGRCLVEERYDWRVAYRPLEHIYEALAGEPA